MTYRLQITNGTETIAPIFYEKPTAEEAIEAALNTYTGFKVDSIATFLNYDFPTRRR